MGKIHHQMKTDKMLANNALRLKGLQIQAKFLGLGFRSLSTFSTIIKFHCPELDNVEGQKLLHLYWNNRKHTVELHNKLETIIETFKTI